MDDFISEVADRMVAYLEGASVPGKVAHPVPYDSLKRTSETKLPLQGNGMESVLDDIDAYLLVSKLTVLNS